MRKLITGQRNYCCRSQVRIISKLAHQPGCYDFTRLKNNHGGHGGRNTEVHGGVIYYISSSSPVVKKPFIILLPLRLWREMQDVALS